jgi:site-specific DNA recombinase
MPTYTYSRFSTDRQTEASIIDQQRACRELAQRKGWKIAAEFTDEGISGAAFGNRPGVLRLLETVCAGDLLLVADLSRLARSQELAPTIERLRFKGVRVISALDGFDSDSPQARMQAGLSGIMSDELRASIRMRVHLALETRAKEARATGGRSYGYDSQGEPVEAEAKIVRELFERYASGEAMKAIADDFNVRGVPSPGANWNRKARRKDGRWLISALHAILHNERYIGRVVWNRSVWVKDPDSGKRVRRERPRSEWIVNEGPALIDEHTWQRSQARLTERATLYTGGPGGQPRYLLSGILQCSICHGRLIITGAKGSHYYCSTHRQGGPAACRMGIGVRRDVAEDLILQPIKEGLLSREAIAKAVQIIRQLHRQHRAAAAQDTPPDVERLQSRVKYYEGLIAADPECERELAPVLDRLRGEISTAKRKAWLQASEMLTGEELPAERAYVEHVERMGELLSGKNVAAAREMLRQTLGDVPVMPNETGEHLIAVVGINPVPLLRAAGLDASNGSGGLLWNQSTVHLVRAASA